METEIKLFSSEFSLLKSVPVPTCIIDNKFDILGANSLFIDFIEAFNDGSTPYSIFKKWMLEKLKKFQLSMLSLEKPSKKIEGWVKINEKDFYFKLGVSYLEDYEDRFVVYILDDTKQYQDKKKLNTAIIQKNKFFSIITHDLRNRFSALLGITSLLDHDDLKNKSNLRDMLNILSSSTQGSYRILERLTEWYKLDSGMLSPRLERINLSYIVNITISALISQAKEKNIEIISKIPLAHKINTDEHFISSILTNLIVNAIKFTNIDGKITLNSEVSDEGYVSISIVDNGIGIPEDIGSSLFSLDKKTESKKGTNGEVGTGFGLVNSKMLVELLGGTLFFESEEGKGTTFTFTIPI